MYFNPTLRNQNHTWNSWRVCSQTETCAYIVPGFPQLRCKKGLWYADEW